MTTVPAKPLPKGELDVVLERGERDFRQLAGSHLFVTGGTGFFGRWIVESLMHAIDRLHLDIRVVVVTRAPERIRAALPQLADHRALEWRQGDVTTLEAANERFDLMVHAAASSDARDYASDPERMYATIVEGTRRVLDFAAGSGAGKLLFVSSGAVYGRQPPDCVLMPETARDPNGSREDRMFVTGATSLATGERASAVTYADGKRVAERLCGESAQHPGLEVKIARCFAFIGPLLPLGTHFASGNFIRDALVGGPIVVSGDGTPYRSYLYTADLVVWLLRILNEGRPMRPYNVGSDHPVSIFETARRVAICGGIPGLVNVLKAAGRGPPERYVPDVSRARSELGLDVWTDLDTAITRTIDWHRGFLA